MKRLLFLLNLTIYHMTEKVVKAIVISSILDNKTSVWFESQHLITLDLTRHSH